VRKIEASPGKAEAYRRAMESGNDGDALALDLVVVNVVLFGDA
jgi:hypothetical protein